MVKLDNCRKLAARHGDYYHAYPPGRRTAVCGQAWPIFPAQSIGHRPLCPRCRAYFAGGGVAATVRPSERALRAHEAWLRRNPNYARTMTHPLREHDLWTLPAYLA